MFGLSGYTTNTRPVSTGLCRSTRHLVKGISADCVPLDKADEVAYDNELKRHHKGAFRQSGQVADEGEADFRDRIDLRGGSSSCCEMEFEAVGICPYCSHPELQPGEMCTGIHVSVADFDKMVFKTKRKGTAFSDTGQKLSEEFCAVIVQRSEFEAMVRRIGFPPELFQ